MSIRNVIRSPFHSGKKANRWPNDKCLIHRHLANCCCHEFSKISEISRDIETASACGFAEKGSACFRGGLSSEHRKESLRVLSTQRKRCLLIFRALILESRVDCGIPSLAAA